MLAVAFCHLQISAVKPNPKAYPAQCVSVGDHLRTVRLDRGLKQTEVAKLIGAEEATIVHWELNQTRPAIQFYPAIIEFLEYNPLPQGETVAEHLLFSRQTLGLTQRELAVKLGVDPTSIANWEHKARAPIGRYRDMLERLFESIIGGL